MRHPIQHRGMALVFVIGMLALFSVVSTVFVRMTAMERHASRNYVDSQRALLLAETGVEYGYGRIRGLRGGALTTEEMSLFDGESGEDADRAALPRGTRRVIGDSAGAQSDAYTVHIEDESGKLNLNDSDGHWNLDDDPDPDGPSDADYVTAPGRLRMLIAGLGNILFGNAGDESPGSIGAQVADAVLTARAAAGGRFARLDQARDALVPDLLSSTQWESLAANVTLHTWQDPNVIRPTHTLRITTPASLRPIPAAHQRDIYLYSDWQTAGFALEPRAPVHLNTASRELLQAMIQPLRGWYLQEWPGQQMYSYQMPGLFVSPNVRMPDSQLYYAAMNTSYTWNDAADNACLRPMIWGTMSSFGSAGKQWRFGQACETPDLNACVCDVDGDGLDAPLPVELAGAMWERIHGRGGGDGAPIGTWEEFEALLGEWLNRIPDEHDCWERWWEAWRPGPGGYTSEDFPGILSLADWSSWSSFGGLIDRRYHAAECRRLLVDLLLANFNPNSQLNDYNPDRHVCRRIDKAQLIAYTTEFSLEPTGVFRVRSTGEVSAPGALLATRGLDLVIEAFRPFRVTTQEQFLRGMRSFNGVMPAAYSTPCVAAAFSTGGCATQVYPEPCLAANPGQYIPDSRYDGFVMLSSLGVSDNGNEYGSPKFIGDFAGTKQPRLFAITQGNPRDGEDGDYAALDFDAIEGPALPLLEGDGSRGENGAFAALPPPAVGSFVESATFVDCRSVETPSETSFPLWHPRDQAGTGRLTRSWSNDNLNTPPAGHLLPDGVLSDAGRGLSFPAEQVSSSIAAGRTGAIAFWLKPNFDSRTSSRLRKLFDMMGRRYGGKVLYPASNGAPVPHTFNLMYIPHQQWRVQEHVERPLGWTPPAGAIYASPNPAHPQDWVANNALCLHFRYWGALGSTQASVTSDTLTSDYPGRALASRPKHHSGHFDPHQWSHVVLHWDQNEMRAPDTLTRLGLRINGVEAVDHFEGDTVSSCKTQLDLRRDDFGMVQACFGGLADKPLNNYVADCTYDDILAWSSQGGMNEAARAIYTRRGRYTRPRDAVNGRQAYVSPAFNLHQELHLPPQEALTLQSASWTLYWPDYNERRDYYGNDGGVVTNPDLQPRNVAGANDELVENPLHDADYTLSSYDPVTVDLAVVDAAGAGTWLSGNGGAAQDISDAQMDSTLCRSAGSPVAAMRLGAGETLRFRCYFNIKEEGNIYESPVLDDVTFRVGFVRPRVLELRLDDAR